MKKIIFFIVTLSSVMAVFSQNEDTIYFNEKNIKCDRNEASTIRIIKTSDSKIFLVEDFTKDNIKISSSITKESPSNYYYTKNGRYVEYHKNGNIKSISSYENNKIKGTDKNYFSNGKLYYTSNYEDIKDDDKSEELDYTFKIINLYDSLGNQLVFDGNGYAKMYSTKNNEIEYIEEGKFLNGLKDSIWIGNFTNGQKYYRENYTNGKLISGVSYDKEGKEYSYDKVGVSASFKDGISSVYKFLGTNINYPEVCKANRIQGKVFVKFTVQLDGTITDVYALNEIHPALKKEAIRVVSLMKMWTPAKLRGQTINSYFTMPVNFTLR